MQVSTWTYSLCILGTLTSTWCIKRTTNSSPLHCMAKRSSFGYLYFLYQSKPCYKLSDPWTASHRSTISMTLRFSTMRSKGRRENCEKQRRKLNRKKETGWLGKFRFLAGLRVSSCKRSLKMSRCWSLVALVLWLFVWWGTSGWDRKKLSKRYECSMRKMLAIS